MADLNTIKKDAQTRMQKSIDSLKVELMKLRTGRANAGLLDHVKVDYYGSEVPISQAAQVVVDDARTISITPWDKSMVGAIEKAIMTSDLGITPNTAGQIIRVIIPALTEERRRELTKIVKHEGENAKVAVRNIRRDANTHIKDLVKEGEASEDHEKRAQDEVQKMTDKAIADIDKLVADKEKELMAV
jgi:ribosome recycling factor